jgi:hypothetical protein
MDPIFHAFRNGNAVLLDGNQLYFFDDKQRLRRIVGGIGHGPGTFPEVCVSSIPTPDDQIVATDRMGRVNIWDAEGDLVQSLIIPDLSASPNAVCVCGRRAFVAGKFLESGTTFLGVKEYDLDRRVYTSSIYEVDIGRRSLAARKGVCPISRAFVCVVDKNTVCCNVSISTDFVVWDGQARTRKENTVIPRGAVPLSSAPDCNEDKIYQEWSRAKSQGAADSIVDTYRSKWSWSASPSLYSDTIVIIRRRTVRPYMLDFYSARDASLIGQCITDRPFMASDSKWIYLCEGYDDTSLVVGKYRAVFEAESIPQVKVVYYQKPPTKLLEQYEKEAVVAAQLPADIGQAEVVAPQGETLRILSELPMTGDRALVLFLSPFDCALQLLSASREFVHSSRGYDLCLVITHEDTCDLRNYAEGIESLYGVPVLMNTDRNKLIEAGFRSHPILIAVNRGGTVLATYSPLRTAATLDAFFESLAGRKKRS